MKWMVFSMAVCPGFGLFLRFGEKWFTISVMILLQLGEYLPHLQTRS